MEISTLAAFWVLSISLVVVPGADWAYAISAGSRGRAVAPAVGGMLLGYLMITLVVAAGIGALVVSVPSILEVITFAGAAYLLWLGVGVLANPSMPGVGEDEADSALKWVIRGFTVSGANPKALLLFLALLPQFTSHKEAWPVWMQIVALGAVQIVNCALVYSLVGIGSKIVLRTRPAVARAINRCSGGAMIVIALILIVEQFRTLSQFSQ
ncbi:LysE family translocator [Paraburkholderia sp. MPAMCS5]|uniref:LysE family translocator n=1 Tax=Paraburkholderia sp. MPAMCS5 TaxID=3112563 RepID=UPI002E185376|nr:LysE family translocator [Paraburkholderia sp. MPAMCS5]